MSHPGVEVVEGLADMTYLLPLESLDSEQAIYTGEGGIALIIPRSHWNGHKHTQVIFTPRGART